MVSSSVTLLPPAFDPSSLVNKLDFPSPPLSPLFSLTDSFSILSFSNKEDMICSFTFGFKEAESKWLGLKELLRLEVGWSGGSVVEKLTGFELKWTLNGEGIMTPVAFSPSSPLDLVVISSSSLLTFSSSSVTGSFLSRSGNSTGIEVEGAPFGERR